MVLRVNRAGSEVAAAVVVGLGRGDRHAHGIAGRGDVAGRVDHLDVQRGLAVVQDEGQLDREVMACRWVHLVEAVAVFLDGGLAVDEQLDGVAGRGRADELGMRSVVTLSPDDPGVVGRVQAEVAHRGRRRVVDLEGDDVARRGWPTLLDTGT